MPSVKKYPKKGRYLLSEPFLSDPNFKRAVVLLAEHNEEGSIGFVLNRPAGLILSEVTDEFKNLDAPLFVGGPVQPNTLHFIHRSEQLKETSEKIGAGLYWGGDFQKLKFLIDTGQIDKDDFKFFLGYSGWGPDQLTQEMQNKSWIVSTQNLKFTFAHDYDHLWNNVLSTMGAKYRLLSLYPEDPSLN